MKVIQEENDNTMAWHYYFKIEGATIKELEDFCKWLNNTTKDHSIIVDLDPSQIRFHHGFPFPYDFGEDDTRDYQLRMMARNDAMLVKLSWC
jgi:hypothetical protein